MDILLISALELETVIYLLYFHHIIYILLAPGMHRHVF